MLQLEDLRIFCTTIVIALLSAIPVRAAEHPYLKPVGDSPAKAQATVAPTVPPPAPLPAQLQTAKKVFISNAGGELNDWYTNEQFSGAPNRFYNRFYAAINDWGRYELVAAPAGADLIFEIHATDLYLGLREGIPRFELTIYDPKTHVVLWTIAEAVDPALLKGNRNKNFDKGVDKLVSDVRELVEPPAPASAPAAP